MGGEWWASRAGRALPPGKGTPVLIEQEAGWAPKPVWTQRIEEKSFAPARDRTPVVQPVVRHYTAWAIPAPMKEVWGKEIQNIHAAQIMFQGHITEEKGWKQRRRWDSGHP
jgi:hypothetical protein